MAVRIGEVEVTFAPFSVARGRVRVQAIGQGTFVKGVDVGNVQDDTSPPRPLPICRLADEVQVRGADGKAGESRILPSVPGPGESVPWMRSSVETGSHVIGYEADVVTPPADYAVVSDSAARWVWGDSPARASLEPGVAAAKLTLNLMLWRWEPIAAQLEL